MTKMKLIDAARIMEATYDGRNTSDIHLQIDVRGVQAVYLKDGTLVIPGTNEFSDWFDFNFDLIDRQRQHGFDVIEGDSGARWHAGFLEHAQIVYVFAKAMKPKRIIGHSLGAASAQIVGMSLKVPTIAFASPRTNQGSARLNGEGWVINLCRVDDAVCWVPPGFLGFRHIGSRYWLTPDDVNAGEDHRIDKYIDLLGKARIKSRLPEAWPPG